MRASAVYACVRLIAGTIASLPVYVFENGKAKAKALTHPLHYLLHSAPNPEQTAFEFWEMTVAHHELRGDGLAEIERSGPGRPVGLWPLHPDQMRIERKNRKLRYTYQLAQGGPVELEARDVLHIRDLSLDGMRGLSRIRMMREGIGMAIAAEKHGAALFENGARPGGVIQMTGELSPEAESRFIKQWNEKHQGINGAHKVALLYGESKFVPISMTSEDAQWLESRNFQTRDIARAFGVPPHMIGDLEKATFSNIEQQAIEFVMHCIRPRLKRIEQALNRALLTPAERVRFNIEFEVDALLRGDYETRMNGHSTAIQSGIKTPNEARGQENLPPVDGGDVLLVPLNMVPASQAANMRTEKAAPKQAGNRAEARSRGERAAGEERIRLREQYHGLFLVEGERIVRGEIREIEKALKREFERGANEFLDWIETYYWGRNIGEAEFVKFFAGRITPVEASYALAIARAAAAESGFEEVSLEDYVQAHVAATAKIHAGRSASQLRALIRENPEAAVEEIRRRMGEWQEKRPGKMAAERVTQSDGAYAREFWRRSGVKELHWHTVGESCPLCRQLDGKKVGIEGAFLPQGESIEAEGVSPLWAGSDVTHPPLHTGCDCYITAG